MKAMCKSAVVVAILCVAQVGWAKVKTKAVEYKQGDTTFQGFFAWDDAASGKRPGILVVHEWWGHNDHARNQAVRLAKAGFVAFALDMYGKGKVTTHPADAKAMATEVASNAELAKARFNAGLAELKKNPNVDTDKIGVVGYCFGGTVALNQARAGLDVDGIATFHAALTTQTPAQKGKVKPRIQVHTGADDPNIPPEQVDAFRKEMTEADARVEVISYPGAKHAFTNPDADKAGLPALAYNADADNKSWDAAVKFFKQVFE
jgi:dienelactone hydrolase